jgi:hypothetical protein
MKQLFTAFALLLILLFHHAGGNMLFQIQRAKIRKEIKQQIKQGVPENELITLRFALTDSTYQHLVWHKKNEFAYQGNMYDVVKRHSSKDSVVFQCVDDKQERILFARLDTLVRWKLQHGPARDQQQLIPFFLSHFYLMQEDIELNPFTQSHRLTYSPYTFCLKTWAHLPEAPPPRHLC